MTTPASKIIHGVPTVPAVCTLLNLNHPKIVAAIREACEFSSSEKITHVKIEDWEEPVLRIFVERA